MNGIARIVTSSLATLEPFAPPYNLRNPDPADNLARGLALVDAAGAQHADLFCLPETFVAAGVDGARIPELAEPQDGPTIRALAERARRYRMNIVAGLFLREGGRIDNTAVLIDRTGAVAGLYSKMHPTQGEIDCGVTPGHAAKVVETDIGRIGLAICFDLNWRELWAEMKAQGADMVCWISAYEGGFPLQAYAWMHEFTVVSSVQSYTGRIIERSGRVLGATSRWGRLAIAEIDLEKRWFHTDGQAEKIVTAQTHYGDRLRVEVFGEEHMFAIERRDPTLSLDEVTRNLELLEYGDYIARCTEDQQAGRRKADELRHGHAVGGDGSDHPLLKDR